MISKAEKTNLSTERKLQMMQSLINDVQSKLRSNTQSIKRLAVENSVLKENRSYLYQIRHYLQKGLKK